MLNVPNTNLIPIKKLESADIKKARLWQESSEKGGLGTLIVIKYRLIADLLNVGDGICSVVIAF